MPSEYWPAGRRPSLPRPTRSSSSSTRGIRGAGRGGEHPEVVATRPARMEVGVEHGADALLGLLQLRVRDAAEGRRSRRRRRQSDQDPQGGGLAGPVRAEKAGDPAGIDAEAEIAYGQGAVVALHQPVDDDRRYGVTDRPGVTDGRARRPRLPNGRCGDGRRLKDLDRYGWRRTLPAVGIGGRVRHGAAGSGRRLLLVLLSFLVLIVIRLRLGFIGRGSKAAGTPGHVGDMVAVALRLLQERSPRSVHRHSLSGKTPSNSGIATSSSLTPTRSPPAEPRIRRP